MINLFLFKHIVNSPAVKLHDNIQYYDITIVLEGKLDYVIDNINYSVCKNDIIVIKQGSNRKRNYTSNASYYSLNFLSDEAIDLPIYNKNAFTPTIKSLLHTIESIYFYTINFQDIRYELLTKLLLIQLSVQLQNQKEHPIVASIKSYIRTHLNENISLTGIAATINYSPSHCSSIFKKEVGKSIIDYAIQEKIRYAKTLILDGTYSLAEVASLVGFSDYNFFSKTFKRRTGISPIKFKKQ